MEINNDAALIEKIKQSDFSAFQTMYHQRQPLVFKFILYKIGDAVLAEDITQEVFLKVWLSRNSLKPNLSIVSFLFKIGHNLVRDQQKHEQVTRKNEAVIPKISPSAFDDPEKALDYTLLAEKIQQVVNTELPKKCQNIFILSRVEGLSNQEIAQLLGISKKTVENQIYAALKILRKKLSDFF